MDLVELVISLTQKKEFENYKPVLERMSKQLRNFNTIVEENKQLKKQIIVIQKSEKIQSDLLDKEFSEKQDLRAENKDLLNKIKKLELSHKKEVERINQENSRLKAQLLMKERIKSNQVGAEVTESAPDASDDGIAPGGPAAAGTGVQDRRDNIPVVARQNREYLGMFEYQREDEKVIVKHLIFDLKRDIAVTLLPGLPAYILFMCIRHADNINDNEKAKSLLNAAIKAIQEVTQRDRDLETQVFWLSTMLRLLYNLKQYSGDKMFQAENTPKQNEQCLRNIDLGSYRQVLSDNAVNIYQDVISHMTKILDPMIVPAILEHETTSSSFGQKPGGMRGQVASIEHKAESPVDIRKALDSLMAKLTSFHKILDRNGVNCELVNQVFTQLYYFICASCLNTLLFGNIVCHWTKGLRIHCNLIHLEQWAKNHNLDSNVLETLDPIIQATRLLQARKTYADLQRVCDTCDKLSLYQIVWILKRITPADDFEKPVPVSFICKMQAKLEEQAEGKPPLLMDRSYIIFIKFTFSPSNIRLEDIEIPEGLNLPMLKKV